MDAFDFPQMARVFSKHIEIVGTQVPFFGHVFGYIGKKELKDSQNYEKFFDEIDKRFVGKGDNKKAVRF